MKESYHLLSNYCMSDPELNAFQRQISFNPSNFEVILIIYLKDGTADSNLGGKARTRPRHILTSKTRPIRTMPFCVTHTKSGNRSVLVQSYMGRSLKLQRKIKLPLPLKSIICLLGITAIL